MSKYYLKPNEDHKNKEIAVGFDTSTGLFYAQVFDELGELIEEYESTNGPILAVMFKFCDNTHILTQAVSKIIMLDIDPYCRLGMFQTWNEFTSEALYNTKTQNVG